MTYVFRFVVVDEESVAQHYALWILKQHRNDLSVVEISSCKDRQYPLPEFSGSSVLLLGRRCSKWFISEISGRCTSVIQVTGYGFKPITTSGNVVLVNENPCSWAYKYCESLSNENLGRRGCEGMLLELIQSHEY